MNYKLLLIAGALAGMSITGEAQTFETGQEAVTNMGVGWNLGNTLEANSGSAYYPSNASYWGIQGLESETYWGQVYVTSEFLTMMKNAGFGAIRVPVTWYNHMDKDGNVNAEWMARVKEVVNYVIDNGLYCILNVHHDTGADSYDGSTPKFISWLKADMTTYNSVKSKYEYLWQQIAAEFKDYGPKLLFESYNEMLDTRNSWNYASSNASGGYNASQATSAYSAINSYAQSFVNVVRASGGNNAQRNLIVNTYGASNGGGTWNTHLEEPLKNLTIPTGEKNHIIVEVHSYPSLNNGLTSALSLVDNMLGKLKSNFTDKGIPVIIGEWGSEGLSSDYQSRKSTLLSFADSYIKKTKECGIAAFYWMGLSDASTRALLVFNEPDLAETIVKAYHGSDFQGQYPSLNDINVYYRIDFTQQWSECNVFQGSAPLSTYSSIVVELDKSYSKDDLQIKAYATNGKEQYNTQDGPVRSMTFSSSTLANGTVSRVTLQAFKAPYEVTVKKVKLIRKNGTVEEQAPSSFWGCTVTAINAGSGIETVVSGDKLRQSPRYNLYGQPVGTDYRGYVIEGGRIIMLK